MASLYEKSAEPRYRLLRPMATYFAIIAVAARIVGSGVIAETIGQRLNKVWAGAAAARSSAPEMAP